MTFGNILKNVNTNQVAGGTDIVRATLREFLPASVNTCILLDILAYDGFPALAALEAI